MNEDAVGRAARGIRAAATALLHAAGALEKAATEKKPLDIAPEVAYSSGDSSAAVRRTSGPEQPPS